ncbi:type II toxin-antitoxin system PemK/MazF family toxin [Candidatus Sumerlaeota bacterium]|nr:type II toxin-antitoxin system PemK/MazF family toxin [Candidatus Sumerlaeota bacterium]
MAKNSRLTFPRRGEVWFARFDPAEGSEIRKTRPAVILQNDIANRFSPLVIVAAISSKVPEKLYPTEVFIPREEGGLGAEGVIILNQIRSMDKSRLIRKAGRLKSETMRRVDRAVALSLALIDI